MPAPLLTAVIGGSLGSDPRSPKTWSGTAQFLFPAMTGAGLLASALGLNLSTIQRSLLMAKNFRRDRDLWRKQFYLDPAYRRALTKAAAALPVSTPMCFQPGHMFSLPEAFPDKPCISYHDGNLPESIKAGFGLQGVSARRIDQALRYEEQAANRMASIFTFSEYLRQSFIHDYHVPASKVVNVGGGVNLASIPPAQPDKSYAAPRILFIGVDFNRKGGPQLVQAFRAVRDQIPAAELHIVGPRALPPELQPTLPPGIIFHGHLSKTDPTQAAQLESLFLASSLFVLPSLYEPFGIAPIEAMLYQVPCLVTNAWALAETVQPGLTGDLVEKGSVDDLAAKLIHLLSDVAALETMGHKAREVALERYTWPQVVQRMAAALNSIQ